MKINKNLLSIFLIIALVIMSAFLVSADADENMTASNVSVCLRSKICDSYLNGATIINVSFNDEYLNQNWSSANLYIQSSSTANSSVSLLNGSAGEIMNVSGNISITAPSTKVEDAADYTLTISLFNGTNFLNKTVTSVIVDNSHPDTPVNLLPTSDTDNTVNFSVNVSDNLNELGSNVTACTLFFDDRNPGSNSYSMSHGGGSCSKQITLVPEQTYRWLVEASDGTNKTNSSTQNTRVDITTSAGKAAQIYVEGKGKPKGGALLSIAKNEIGGIPIGVLAILAILVLVVVVVIKKR